MNELTNKQCVTLTCAEFVEHRIYCNRVFQTSICCSSLQGRCPRKTGTGFVPQKGKLTERYAEQQFSHRAHLSFCVLVSNFEPDFCHAPLTHYTESTSEVEHPIRCFIGGVWSGHSAGTAPLVGVVFLHFLKIGLKLCPCEKRAKTFFFGNQTLCLKSISIGISTHGKPVPEACTVTWCRPIHGSSLFTGCPFYSHHHPGHPLVGDTKGPIQNTFAHSSNHMKDTWPSKICRRKM